MSIEEIKETLSKEMVKTVESSDFKTTHNILEGVLRLLHSPESEEGQYLKWSNVELRLKPEMYLLTGIPSSGKSTWLDNVMINSIKMYGYKWAVFSPESHPVELHMKQLVEIYTESNFHGRWHGGRTTEAEVIETIEALSDKLYMMTPTAENLPIEKILELAEYLVENYGVNSIVLDPYNEFSHTRPAHMSETEYVSRFLGDIRRFINKHKVMFWIVAHPTKMKKEEVSFCDGTYGLDYPIPTAYDIAGSANFYNKPDNIVTVHRDKDPSRNPENLVTIAVQKVRRKTTGKLGNYMLKFEYKYGTYQ
jgi:twinkle protein